MGVNGRQAGVCVAGTEDATTGENEFMRWRLSIREYCSKKRRRRDYLGYSVFVTKYPNFTFLLSLN